MTTSKKEPFLRVPLESGILVEAHVPEDYKKAVLKRRAMASRLGFNVNQQIDPELAVVVYPLSFWNSSDIAIHSTKRGEEIKQGTICLLVHIHDLCESIPVIPDDARYQFVLLIEGRQYLARGKHTRFFRPYDVATIKE